MIKDDDEAEELVEEDPELVTALTAANEAEDRLREAQQERDDARSALVSLLKTRDLRTVTAPNHWGELYKVTVVSGQSLKIDSDALKLRVGVRRWNALTERKVDYEKVAQAVADGKLDPEELSEVSEIVVRRDYPRLTRMDY